MQQEACILNADTKEYLSVYYGILKDMIYGMTTAKLGESISDNFIAQRIPHHRAAIRMSENILKYTGDRTLQSIAAGIISEQTKSIENMQSIRRFCGEDINCKQDLTAYKQSMDQIMQTMFAEMASAAVGNNINCNFIREMIPHHKGAVRMSERTLRFPICPELKPILEAIITSQKRGIRQMQELSARLGCGKEGGVCRN